MKGQINLELLAAAFVYLLSLGILMTAGSGILPQFADNLEKKSLTMEANQISSEILTHPGHHTTAGGRTDWHKSISTLQNIDAFGLANNSSSFLEVDREKINRIKSFETSGPKRYFNYSQFKEFTGADNQYQFRFIWTPLIDTEDSFTKNSVQPLNDSMAGYWPLDSVTGPVRDKSGSGNQGTNEGGERDARGVFSTNGTYFHVSNYTEIPDSEDFRGGKNAFITVTAWFKLDRFPSEPEPIVSKYWNDENGDWELLYQDSCPGNAECRGSPPYIGFRAGAGDRGGENEFMALAGPITSPEEWHFGAFVLDQRNDELELYLDGEKMFDDSIDKVSNATDSNLHIGTRILQNSNIDESFEGKIDEVRIYNDTLSGQQIRRIYSSGPPDITEPQTDYYDSAENTVHYGSETLNGIDYRFLVTGHNGRYNTTYVSRDWDFRGESPVGIGERFSEYGTEEFNLTTIQNRDNIQGSLLTLRQELKIFGASVDSDSQVIRLDRYVLMEEEPMRVEVLAW